MITRAMKKIGLFAIALSFGFVSCTGITDANLDTESTAFDDQGVTSEFERTFEHDDSSSIYFTTNGTNGPEPILTPPVDDDGN